MKQRLHSIGLALILLAVMLVPITAQAQTPGLVMGTPFTSVVAESGSKVTLELKVINQADAPRQVDLTISTPPAGWEVGYFKSFPELQVWRLYLLADETVTLEFRAQLAENAAAGDYSFTLGANAPDISASLDVTISVKKTEVSPGGMKVSSRFPQLSGSSGTSFEFLVDVENQLAEDRTFDFIAEPPQGWTVTIKPQYEQKQIASIALKSRETRSVTVTIDSPPRIDPGDYDIPFVVRAPGGTEELIQLRATVTGSYSLDVSTSTGLLNARARAGVPAPLTLRVLNTGTAPLTSVNLFSSAPSEWKVTFNPQRIDNLNAGEEREVAVELTPRAKAIPGDYALTLTASSAQASKDLNMRITVTTATAWGAIGIGIVVVVLAGLVGLFVRLGRR